MILLNSEVLATQPDFITWDIALRLDLFIMSLFLKFLGVVKILLANGYEVLKLER